MFTAESAMLIAASFQCRGSRTRCPGRAISARNSRFTSSDHSSAFTPMPRVYRGNTIIYWRYFCCSIYSSFKRQRNPVVVQYDHVFDLARGNGTCYHARVSTLF